MEEIQKQKFSNKKKYEQKFGHLKFHGKENFKSLEEWGEVLIWCCWVHHAIKCMQSTSQMK